MLLTTFSSGHFVTRALILAPACLPLALQIKKKYSPKLTLFILNAADDIFKRPFVSQHTIGYLPLSVPASCQLCSARAHKQASSTQAYW